MVGGKLKEKLGLATFTQSINQDDVLFMGRAPINIEKSLLYPLKFVLIIFLKKDIRSSSKAMKTTYKTYIFQRSEQFVTFRQWVKVEAEFQMEFGVILVPKVVPIYTFVGPVNITANESPPGTAGVNTSFLIDTGNRFRCVLCYLCEFLSPCMEI